MLYIKRICKIIMINQEQKGDYLDNIYIKQQRFKTR
nr:MAG TPA: hypothetical protein [Caudoviricetes sp.]